MKSIRLLAMALSCGGALISSGVPANAADVSGIFVSTSAIHSQVAEADFTGTANGVTTEVSLIVFSATGSSNLSLGPPNADFIDFVYIVQTDATGNFLGDAIAEADGIAPQISPGLAGETFGPVAMQFGNGGINVPSPAIVSATWTPSGQAQHDVTMFGFHGAHMIFADHNVSTLQPATVMASIVDANGLDWVSGLRQDLGDLQAVNDQNLAVSGQPVGQQ
jgi:hypothetical protein